MFPENKEIMSALKTDDNVKKYMKKLMPFVAHLKVCHTIFQKKFF